MIHTIQGHLHLMYTLFAARFLHCYSTVEKCKNTHLKRQASVELPKRIAPAVE